MRLIENYIYIYIYLWIFEEVGSGICRERNGWGWDGMGWGIKSCWG